MGLGDGVMEKLVPVTIKWEGSGNLKGGSMSFTCPDNCNNFIKIEAGGGVGFLAGVSIPQVRRGVLE